MTEWLVPLACGLGAGILSAWGVGGGTILLLVMTLLLDVDQRTAQAINLLFFLPTAATALVCHARNGCLDKPVLRSAIPWAVVAAVVSRCLDRHGGGPGAAAEALRCISAVIRCQPAVAQAQKSVLTIFVRTLFSTYFSTSVPPGQETGSTASSLACKTRVTSRRSPSRQRVRGISSPTRNWRRTFSKSWLEDTSVPAAETMKSPT